MKRILIVLFGIVILALALSARYSQLGYAAVAINHYYNGVDSSDGYNILDDQSAENGVYTSFSFPDSTFHITGDSAAIYYTVKGKPFWLSWSPADRAFYGTPVSKPGAPLQASYPITVTASAILGGPALDSLSFTLKVANVSPETGRHVPVCIDPTNEFYIRYGAPAGTPLTPNLPVGATDRDGDIAGYRIIAPAGITSPLTVDLTGTVTTAGALSLPPGRYKYTIEAYDATGYQDTSHIIVNVLSDVVVWNGTTSSDWHTLSNWSAPPPPPTTSGIPPYSLLIPERYVNVYIPSGTPYNAVINAPASAGQLVLESGASLTMNSDLIMVSSLWLKSGATLTVTAGLTVSGALELDSGASLIMNSDLYMGGHLYLYDTLNTGSATLTSGYVISDGINSPSGYEVVGNFRRINLAADTSYTFNHPATRVAFHNGSGLSEATVSVIASAPPGDWNCVLARYYRIVAPGWTPGSADLQLHYTPGDGVCASLKLYRAPSGTTDWSEVAGVTGGGVSPKLYLSVSGLDNVAGYDFALGSACLKNAVVSNAADSGPGSLRQAIADACANGVITFAGDYTIPLANQLTIERNLTIDGAGHAVVVSGENAARVFQVSPGITFNLNQLTVTQGNAEDGGGVYNAGVLNVTNSVFISNTASANGGGMYNCSASATLTNVTFSGNSASSGGGIYNDSSSAMIRNSILWGDSGGEIADNGSAPEVSYSVVQGGYSGAGNINQNPLFVEAGRNLRLRLGSPAVEAGAAAGCPAVDLDGLARPNDGDGSGDAACDMGAYEAGEMVCGLIQDNVYTFPNQSGLSMQVAALGDNLDCLYVDEMETSHASATAGLKTGRYWTIRGLQNDKINSAGGFTVTLTLPTTAAPDAADKVCRYTGSGEVWDCAMTAFDAGAKTLTRAGVTAFSDWAIGERVGPTNVTLLSLASRRPGNLFLAGAAGLLALCALGVVALRALGAVALRRFRR